MNPIPFMVVGDGPQEPTGLAKIARDLCALLHGADLPIDLVQIGGVCPPTWPHWRHYPLDRSEDWGAGHVKAYYQDLFGQEPGILWVIWDPSRLFYFADLGLPVQLWSYPAIDAANMHGVLSGPALYGLQRADRVIAYGQWASGILKHSLGDQPIAYLPHGLVLDNYTTPATEDEHRWVRHLLGQHYRENMILVGCVATNQPRKDLSLYCRALRILRERGYPVFGWLHTDVLVKAWSVPQLIEDCELAKQLIVTLDNFTDRQIAVLYQHCGVTINPALGEGFGYGLVESLAAGVPAIHGDGAGGAELLPKTEWRVPARGFRLDSIYALQRPVFTPEDFANAAERALRWQHAVGRVTSQAYCQGSVAHLDWDHLTPRWTSWIKKGLNL